MAEVLTAEVKVDSTVRHQAILGWGKTTPWLPGTPRLRQQAIEQAVNDFGINRLRFEGFCGNGTNTVRREVLMKVFKGNQPPAPIDIHNRIPVWVRVANGGPLLRAGARDIEGDRVSYKWSVLRQPAKAAAVLETPDQQACRARGMTVPGDYAFRLAVSDGTSTVTVERTVPVYP